MSSENNPKLRSITTASAADSKNESIQSLSNAFIQTSASFISFNRGRRCSTRESDPPLVPRRTAGILAPRLSEVFAGATAEPSSPSRLHQIRSLLTQSPSVEVLRRRVSTEPASSLLIVLSPTQRGFASGITEVAEPILETAQQTQEHSPVDNEPLRGNSPGSPGGPLEGGPPGGGGGGGPPNPAGIRKNYYFQK